MNKIKSDKINFNNDDFVVNLNVEDVVKKFSLKKELKQNTQEPAFEEPQEQQTFNEQDIIIEDAKDKAALIIEEAKQKADKESFELIEKANTQAEKIIENARREASDLLLNSQEELEQIKIKATREGYEEGHKEGIEKSQEELREKIEDFSKFCSTNLEIREKILKSASKDILDIIENISRKILYKEITPEILDKIIQNTILKLEKKEDITIIVSQKYAQILFELQKKALAEEIELNFEDFKQYKGFNIVYNPSYSDDTIIVENLKERFDASLKSQLDIIIRDIYEKTKNAQFDLEDYIEENQNETQRPE